MKAIRSAFAILLAASLPGWAALPGGEVIELHECELYTGGCTASAQSTLEGRALVRVWQFSSGSWEGVDFDGLTVAAVETSEANLAAERSAASRAVLYVNPETSETQRAALVAWAQDQALGRGADVVAVRAEPIRVNGRGDQREIAIGEVAAIRTESLPGCSTGSCGEAMWYAPRSAHGEFRALFNAGSRVSEPALNLEWKAGGRRSVFAAAFGDSGAATAALTR